jgi:hypothetical protein
MRDIFWNIRELGKAGRKQCIIKTIRKNAIDFIGIQETKSVAFSDKYLESLTSGRQLCWNWLPANGSAGGILLDVNKDLFMLKPGIGQAFHLDVGFQVEKMALKVSFMLYMVLLMRVGNKDLLMSCMIFSYIGMIQ